MGKICNYVKDNYKFSLFLFIMVAVLGTVFSLDKSFKIKELKDKNYQLEQSIELLKAENVRLIQEFKRSTNNLINEKRELILEQEKLLSDK